MCNDFGNNVSYSEYLTAFSHTRIRVKWPAAAPNLEPRDDIWPTDPAPVIRRLEDGEKVCGATMGLSACEAKRRAHHQFPFGGTTLPGRALSCARVSLL